jgi:starch synthase
MKKSKIFFVSAEVYPFVKGGRGAEFAGSLPPYLQALGHEVRVLMPKYSLINERKHIIRDIIRLKDIPISMASGPVAVSVKSGFIPETKTQIYFADSDKYFKRSDLYRDIRTGLFFKDNDERFIFLAKVAVETLKTLGWQPDIVHCCDWPTGLLPAIIRDEQKKNNFFKKTIVAFSVNELRETGLFDKAVFEKLAVSEDHVDKDKCMFKNKFSFLKTGIAFSDAVTIPNTHKELKSIGKSSNDFEAILSQYKSITDVPFAGDHNLWNPGNNSTLYKSYTAEKLERKQTNKEGFLEDKRTGFSGDKLIVGILAEDIEHQQKAIAQFIKGLKDIPLQFFIIGNQNPSSIGAIKAVTAKNANHKVFTYHDPDDQYRHNFFAVCDLFYIPPTEHYSELYYLNGIHYGAIPLLPHNTHVTSLFDPIKEKSLNGNAFIFAEDKELIKRILLASELFKEKEKWDVIVRRVMKSDLSWNKFTSPFIKIYERSLAKL